MVADHSRTYVRMTSYLISDPGKPWLTLFSSPNLEAVAEAIVAQPRIEPSSIYATLDGKSRSLSVAERITLFECVLELRPDDQQAAAGLTAAHDQNNS
jgi:hypothetical protein